MSSNLKARYEKIISKGDCMHVAFWGYDNFPYVLGSPVQNLKIAENCKVSAYSSAYGGYITAQYLSENLQESIDALDKLELLREEYQEAQYALREEYKDKAKKIAPYLSNIIDGKA